MINLRKISPMVRSIGTVGAVAGLVGAVTFANLTSNVVALDPNTLTSATAHLQISNDGGSTYSDTSVAGITANLVPGVPSAPYAFKLKNTGDIPLNVSAHIPTDFTGSLVSPNDVTLTLNCGTGDVSFTLAAWAGGSAAVNTGALAAGGAEFTCTEVVTLSGSYAGSGGQTVTPFKVEFTGTQVVES